MLKDGLLSARMSFCTSVRIRWKSSPARCAGPRAGCQDVRCGGDRTILGEVVATARPVAGR
jgi:hypothetical protein